jgi:hypothetical protein
VLDQSLGRHRSQRGLIVHEQQMYRLVRHLRVRHSFDAVRLMVKRERSTPTFGLHSVT